MSNAPKHMTPIRTGTENGIPWAVCAAPMPGANGYVLIPGNHPWHGLGYDEIAVKAPGGLTFGDSDGWIGFDTLHAWDCWQSDEIAKLGRTYRDDQLRYARECVTSDVYSWTIDDVERETRKLARRVAEAGDQA